MSMNHPLLRRNAIRFLLFAVAATLLLVTCRQQPEAMPTATAELPATAAATGESAAPPTVGETPTGTEEPAAGTPAPPADAWAAVRARGRIIIGTSADYPPFAFYTDEFELAGYDIALARLLGERLGVDVEFNDMAFDGLGGALRVGQIDAALAAISITSERREQIDFSNLYFVSEGAALARADAGITINGIEDLAPHRVAVQEGSVFHIWVTETAVETGLLPPDQLLVYVAADNAVADLRAGLVDVVIADTLPLELAARDGELAVVGRALNRQRIAVALAPGSTLLSPINEALFELQREGELVRLAEMYLSLDETELQPLPEPDATPETPPQRALPAGCVDAMTLIAHLSLDDDGMRSPPPVNPGTPFTKTWRIRNNGTCTWTDGYLLTPVGGNVPQAGMGGAATPLGRVVAPGETVDVTVNLVAPLLPGVYQGFWSMRSPNGLLFGDRIWVGITVPAQATPTPPPTATTSPTIRFTVDRSAIRAGECVTFSWNVQNGDTVYFNAQGQPFQQNRVAPAGSQTECPQSTTFYELRVVMPSGATELSSLRVDVQPAPESPFFESFTVTPGNEIAAGDCVDVRWRITGQVTHVRVTRNDTTLWNGAPLRGTSRDCPPAGEAVYSIEATGPGGTSRALQNVTVLASTPGAATPGAPTATPPPAGQLPVINSFTASPNRIFAGSCLTVNWNVSGNVQRVQLRRDGVLVVDFALFSGNVTDCLNAEGTVVYRLDAFNAQGASVFQRITVTVVR